jgi:nucleoside-triphosphatase THEP1
MNILLFSRAIRTGKTTELIRWCATQNDVGGIAMPDENGFRHMRDVRTGMQWLAQCRDPDHANELLQTVGRFSFFRSAFQKGNDILLRPPTTQWLVIDEIGTLELQGMGFRPALDKLIGDGITTNLLLVVRDTLLAEVVAICECRPYRVVHSL